MMKSHASQEYISMENPFRREGKTLEQVSSEIGLNSVETSVLSSWVCQSCGRKIFNTV